MYDMENLSKLAEFKKSSPQAWDAFQKFDMAALSDGAIPRKYKELIAIAVAHTTQCPYCIELHVDAARKEGVSDQELSEAIFIAAALRAGAAVVHGTHCF